MRIYTAILLPGVKTIDVCDRSDCDFVTRLPATVETNKHFKL